ncbi:histidyl-tRNA synthetase [Pullulanibacillus pueri]|uniref:Histidine--tRNA ligase n=1 Tax=Pullulanibacillus pueri TaxID=1437324 RepID=A0A8J2ZTZ8_9BACL|nr:histidine--tRNA ligase [Pullulanibacillus pueri]MBM7681157.1 histidyl-tRNA synthetase [Pullulanibacillus pueri]GGH77269.1 histidine--tRNA ligase 1 [Pullulanibacillus pueri]
MKLKNVKGTQDFLPEQEKIRRRVRATLEEVFTQYGCEPLETPILNEASLLASKYGGGAEILQEMYTLSDRGQRALALRYDLTIPFAKVVAMNPKVRLPFKRYEIGKVFRDGPIKAGRFREFTQCDVDIVGVESGMAEAELMTMAIDAFSKLEMNVVIQYNNRKLLTGILEVLETPTEKVGEVILILDKLEKIGLEEVMIELQEKNVPIATMRRIETLLQTPLAKDLSYYERFTSVSNQLEQGLAELKELQVYLETLGLVKICQFNPFLARGLEIYTGTIYEIFLAEGEIKSSIGSGGRYNNAIGGLMGKDQTFATVGISFGLDVIYTALQLSEKTSDKDSQLDYYIVPIDAGKEALVVARSLRQKGFKVEVEMRNRKLNKALERANKENISQVIIIGENEIKNNRYTIKEMKTGEERLEAFNY